MPNLDLTLTALKGHMKAHEEAFTGLRVSVDAHASPTALYDRGTEELVLVVAGRSEPGAILYRLRSAEMGVGNGVVLRFPDWVRPLHVKEALYGAPECVNEVALMHHLLMQLDGLEINSPDATAIYDALNAPSKKIMDMIFSMGPIEVN